MITKIIGRRVRYWVLPEKGMPSKEYVIKNVHIGESCLYLLCTDEGVWDDEKLYAIPVPYDFLSDLGRYKVAEYLFFAIRRKIEFIE